jgi:uncharacterized protein YjbI with pentapeptide repeats
LNFADLRGANLSGAKLAYAFLGWADLRRAKLSKADLYSAHLLDAKLCGARLDGAELSSAFLTRADLREADLSGANLSWADLLQTDLRHANLSGAVLNGATLIETNLEGANLTGCSVYGISAWDLKLKGAIQSNLVITPASESAIEVDNLEVAQFIYLLLHNDKIRSIIDTIASKVVLILGRFTPERKAVLESIREELRKRNYLPILFDFEKPTSKDLTGTISTLANMARFIIADLTNPSSVPHELAMVVPSTVVPVQAIILEGEREYAMFIDLTTRYNWVLEPLHYKTDELLIAQLVEKVIAPAERKAQELRARKPS